MLNPMQFSLFCPTRIEFGFGRAEGVGFEACKLGISRILIVSDLGVAQVGLLERVSTLLQKSGIHALSYTDIETNPDAACVDRGARLFDQSRSDGLLAVGGGSPIDVAKAIGVVVTGGFPVEDYGMERRPIEKPIPPLITLPTTAGTGSEVTRGAIISNRKEKIKMAVRAPVAQADFTSPKVCILDPELTFSLPRSMTIATGMDALCHAVEQLVSRSSHPASRALAREVIRLVLTYLSRAASNGHDAEARSAMLQASALAGMGMAVGLGAAHALAHALGAHYHLHHGLAVGVLLPGVMMANLPFCEIEYAQAHRNAKLSGCESSVRSEALCLVRRVVDLMLSLGVPDLSEIQSEIDLEVITSAALKEKFLLGTNPRQFTRQDLAAILSTSYKEVHHV